MAYYFTVVSVFNYVCWGIRRVNYGGAIMTLSSAFLLLLALVESGNQDIPAYTGPATGPFQIMPIAVREANRIVYAQDPRLGENFYSLEDRHDYHMARSIAYVNLSYWKPRLEKKYEVKWDVYDALAMWYYGPNKWTPRSKNTEESKRRNDRYDRYLGEQK